MASGALSPGEVTASLLQQASCIDDQIRAWQVLDPARAREEAARAEMRRRSRGHGRRLLGGVPIGVKDVFDVKGYATGVGFRPFLDRIAKRDAAIIGSLRSLGATILGKMVTTQFAWTDPSVTRNPWDLDRTPGGSSSGPAAGVACCLVPLAVTSQTAGSTLRPAAYCGVVGYKPSIGRGSLLGAFPLAWTLDQLGVIAKCVYDCELFGAAIGAVSTDAAPVNRAPRIGILSGVEAYSDDDTNREEERVLSVLSSAGARLSAVTYDDFGLCLAVHRVILLAEAAAVHSKLVAEHAEDYHPNILAHVRVGALVQAVDYAKALRVMAGLRAEAHALFQDVDAVLLPTASSVSPLRSSTGDASLQSPFSLLGLPAVTIPTGLSRGGLPFGSQLVGAPRRDGLLLAVAGWCQNAVGPLPTPALVLRALGQTASPRR
jgi:aspartyl-tRNA(Asn)/glutamyl-tRNA(Gln) amidotransferase subunit A